LLLEVGHYSSIATIIGFRKSTADFAEALILSDKTARYSLTGYTSTLDYGGSCRPRQSAASSGECGGRKASSNPTTAAVAVKKCVVAVAMSCTADLVAKKKKAARNPTTVAEALPAPSKFRQHH